jgi:hypothetical protein
MKHRNYALAFWLGLFLFSIYLLSFSGKIHVMDELAVLTAGNNLARYGRADINPLIWTQQWTPNPPGIWGNDGNLYTKKAPGISFLATPLLWLGHTLPHLNAVHVGLLLNSIVTALTASLLFIWLIELGYARLAAGLTALGYGLCTIAWIYARMFWESTVLGLCYLIAIWAVRRATAAGTRRRRLWLLLCGTIMAFGLTLRFEALVAVILIGVYLSARLSPLAPDRVQAESSTTQSPATRQAREPGLQGGRRMSDRPGFIRRVLATLAPLSIYGLPSLLAGAGLAYFNFIRYGSLGETGYTQEFLFRAPWVGGYGLLFSPGRGLFLYAPLLVLLFFGVRPAWRRLPRAYFWLITTICLFYWLFYGSWFAWGGTWGWGPRFLLPLLPLLMLFVAEPLEWAIRPKTNDPDPAGHRQPTAGTTPRETPHPTAPGMLAERHPPQFLRLLARLGIGVLVMLSLVVNFLGLAVDFNEYFLRLGRNDNFVFNWAAFPPLGHWRILQDGLVDIIWLRPGPTGLSIDWSILAPALLLFILATAGLMIALKQLTPESQRSASSFISKRLSSFILHSLSFILLSLAALILTYQMMTATARTVLQDEQTRADVPVLQTLAAQARPGDEALLIPMPPYGDAQELSTLLLAYLDRPIPVFAWIESEPRAILPEERARVRQATRAEAARVWLFERWLSQSDPLGPTAARLNQEAFQIQAQWFERSGRLSLYSLGDDTPPTVSRAVGVPFEGGLKLVDFAVFGNEFAPGATVNVRLTWQAAEAEQLRAAELPAGSIIGFLHLLDDPLTGQNLAQQDRLLLELQDIERSALRPGQTVPQGYGLRLPADLAAGSYPLIAGLYVANTGQRLQRADGNPDDFLYLTNITVQPGPPSVANR